MVYELFIDHEVSRGMIWDIVCVKKFMCIEQVGMGGCIEQGSVGTKYQSRPKAGCGRAHYPLFISLHVKIHDMNMKQILLFVQHISISHDTTLKSLYVLWQDVYCRLMHKSF